MKIWEQEEKRSFNWVRLRPWAMAFREGASPKAAALNQWLLIGGAFNSCAKWPFNLWVGAHFPVLTSPVEKAIHT